MEELVYDEVTQCWMTPAAFDELLKKRNEQKDEENK